jgi:hypothetical protein
MTFCCSMYSSMIASGAADRLVLYPVSHPGSTLGYRMTLPRLRGLGSAGPERLVPCWL